MDMKLYIDSFALYTLLFELYTYYLQIFGYNEWFTAFQASTYIVSVRFFESVCLSHILLALLYLT